MADFPALPVFTDALLADTLHLSRDEFGAYMLLLFTAWRRPKCDLPDDDTFLAKVARCDGRKWVHLRPIMAQFHVIADGVWTQKRLQKERKYVDDLSKKQRENVNVRWNKNKDLGDTTVIPNGYQTDTPTPTPTPIEDIIPPIIPQIPDWMDKEAWEAFLSMRKSKRTPNTPRAIKMLITRLGAFREKGHDPTAILDASTVSGWTNIYEPKEQRNGRSKPPSANDKWLAGAAIARARRQENGGASQVVVPLLAPRRDPDAGR